MAQNTYIVTIMGPGGVGKSSITIRFVCGTFVKKYDPTIEDNYKKQMEVDGRAIMLDLMDTAGQEEFATLRGQYISSGQGFILVFSVISESSFASVDQFRRDILRTKDSRTFPIVLVANKVDCTPEERKVSTEEAAAKAKAWGVKLIETSAKTNLNVTEPFLEIVRTIDDWRNSPDNTGKRNRRGSSSEGRKRCVLF